MIVYKTSAPAEYFCISESSNALITDLITKQPVAENVEDRIGPIQNYYTKFEHSEQTPTIPNMTNALNFKTTRESLPVFKFKDEIISAITHHQVIVISSETGK